MGDILVTKFGGSSLATIDRIKAVAKHLAEVQRAWGRVIAVVSAMGDDTDELIDLANRIGHTSSDREMDQLLAIGENKSAALLAMAIKNLGTDARSLTGAQAGIMTAGKHGQARIIGLKDKKLLDRYSEGVLVITGFQGTGEDGETKTLGRGGSDASAVALAVALGKAKCEIYTDVDGVYAVDPRYVPNAKRFNNISYAHMISMGNSGAGVMMPRSVEIGLEFDLPIWVKRSPSIGRSDGGTLIKKIGRDTIEITDDHDGMMALAIKKVSGINISGIQNKPGIAAEIFDLIKGLNIIDSAQGLSVDAEAAISVIADRSLGKTIDEQLRSSALSGLSGVTIKMLDDLSALTLVDEKMPNTNGYFAAMSRKLADAGINIIGITSADKAITVIVRESDMPQAAKSLAEAFDLTV